MFHSKLQRAHREKPLPKLILKILLPDFISKLLNFKRLEKSEVAEVLSNQNVDSHQTVPATYAIYFPV